MLGKWRNQTEKKQVGGKNYILRKHIVSRLISYFAMGGHSVTQTKLKYENV